MNRAYRSNPFVCCAVAGLLGAGLLSGWVVQAADPVSDELTFANGLVNLGFPDYAEKVVAALLKTNPEAKAQAAAVKIKILANRGKFDEAEALVKSLPPDNPETLVMRLTLGDMFYAWGKMPKAREIYDAFFKQFPKGPPQELVKFFGESAYKYAQMLLNSGDMAGAVQAYRYVILSKPDPEIMRGVQTEMAEMLFKLGQKATGADRKKYFDEARKICLEIQWGGTDVAFGKTVVIMAHMALMNGDKAGARKTINDYLPMLKSIDEALKEDRSALKYSPMAQCKYMLGTLGEEDLRAMVEQAGQATTQEIKDLAKQTLSYYYTVLINYPTSAWAGDAGKRGEALVDFLRSKGMKINPPKNSMATVADNQLKEAKLLFQQQDFKAAAQKYEDVLNLVPEFTGHVPALGELARCYVEQKDYLYAKAITGHIAERYSRAAEPLMEDAGNALLAIAQSYEGLNEKGLAAEVNRQYFEAFPRHKRAASTVFRNGEEFFRAENYGDAAKFYAKIVEQYPKERVFVDALNRLAYCHVMLGEYTNALPLLARYVQEVSPSPEQLSARLRLADTHRMADQLIPALNEYARVMSAMAQEPAKYGAGPEDVAKNNKSLERAMFWKPLCYSRLKKPEDQVTLFQGKAIEGFTEFLAKFPKSELAPSALSGLGTLYFLQNKPEDAERIYARIEKEYPDSEQAQNIAYSQIDSLMKIGRSDEAVKAFAKMLANTQKFKPSQFLLVGNLMNEAKQYDTAIKAFDQVRSSSTDRAVWEPASIGISKAYAAQGNHVAAIKPLEELLAKYTNTGYKVDAGFILGRAYAESGAKETDAAKRIGDFNKAIKSLNTVRLVAGKEPDIRARADFETAQVQLLKGDKEEAQASFQRLILLSDMGNPKVIPWLEKGVEEGVPLILELGRFSDVLDLCEMYLRSFPQGRVVDKVRQWRDQAKIKQATSGK
jgi:tetratricopeptide (TPR) repeat protein